MAALFGLHPLQVESVAWVAERKDVLSTFFGLLALLSYARYAREASAAKQPAGRSRQSGHVTSRSIFSSHCFSSPWA